MAWTKKMQAASDAAYAEFQKKAERLRAEHRRLTDAVHNWYDREMAKYERDPNYVDPKGSSAVVGGPPSRGFQIRQLKIQRKIRLSAANKPLFKVNDLFDEYGKYVSALAMGKISPDGKRVKITDPKTVFDIEVRKWKNTASGRWRRAQTGDWPDWVDRIVIRLLPYGKGAELRIFGYSRNQSLKVNIHGETMLLARKHVPQTTGRTGAGNYIMLTERQLKIVMGADYNEIKPEHRKG